MFIVISPLVGLLVGGLIMALLRLIPFTRRREDSRVFKGLQLVSSAAFSLGHGSNDAQKTMGVITVLLISTGYLSGAGTSWTYHCGWCSARTRRLPWAR